MILRQSPLSKRPGSARATHVRDQVKKIRDQTFAVSHGSTLPTPDGGEVHGGPGQIRTFDLESKYRTQDVLNDGEERLDAARRLYAMGPRSDTSDANRFRTLNFSKINAERHNWQRVDTFQTNAGHIGSSKLNDEATEQLQAQHRQQEQRGHDMHFTGALREQIREDLRLIIQDELQASMSIIPEAFATAAKQIQDELRNGLQADITAMAEKISEDVGKVVRSEIELDLSPIFQKIEEKSMAAQWDNLLDQMQKMKTAVVKSCWETKSALNMGEASREVRCMKSQEMDFSEVLEAIRSCNESLLTGLGDLKSQLQQAESLIQSKQALTADASMPKAAATDVALPLTDGAAPTDTAIASDAAMADVARRVQAIHERIPHLEERIAVLQGAIGGAGTSDKAADTKPQECLQQELEPILVAIQNLDAQLKLCAGASEHWPEALSRMWNTHQQMAKMSAEHQSALMEMQRLAGMSPLSPSSNIEMTPAEGASK